MVFSSTVFLFLFLPAVLVFYHLPFIKSIQAKNIVLLLASLLFYAWGEPVFVFVLLFSILVNWVSGLMMPKHGKLFLIISIVYNVGVLFVCKYMTAITNAVNAAAGRTLIPFGGMALPIGISFFTFQIMSYTIDVYRKTTPPQKSIFNLALYITMFPQLIAGPIVRYNTVDAEISARSVTTEDFAYGLRRFMIGLGKKVLLANYMGVVADNIFGMTSGGLSVLSAWYGVLCYALQIYFDFSGYSDMALGLGRLFNITLPENFDSPYTACSIVDFWRRWHMTLSAFLRDYLYIPLGGNRRGTVRRYLNLMATMLLGGLWHGAGWTFVIWGGLHGACLTLNHLWRGARMPRLPKPLAWMATFLAVVAGWVFFRSATCGRAFSILSGMAGLNGIVLPPDYALAELVPGVLRFLGIGVAIPGVWHFEGRFQTVALAVGFLLCLALPNSFAWRSKYPWRDRPAKTRLIVGTALVPVVLSLHRVSEFLYFRF